MQRGTKLARMSMVAAALAVMGACGGGEGEESTAGAGAPASEAAPPAAPPAAPAAGGGGDGAQVFASNGLCFSCHGPAGVGTALAPSLTDAEWINFQARPSLDEVVTLIKTGVPQPVSHPAPMPPMGGGQLTDEQVRSVAEYVLSLSAG